MPARHGVAQLDAAQPVVTKYLLYSSVLACLILGHAVVKV